MKNSQPPMHVEQRRGLISVRHGLATLCIIGFTLLPPVAHARDGDLWVLAIGEMCIAQNPAYRERPFGKLLFLMFSQKGDFDAQLSTQCFKDRQWASPQICDDVMDLDEKALANLEPLYARHRSELLAMEPLTDYFNDIASRSTRLPCPDPSVIRRP